MLGKRNSALKSQQWVPNGSSLPACRVTKVALDLRKIPENHQSLFFPHEIAQPPQSQKPPHLFVRARQHVGSQLDLGGPSTYLLGAS
mmetsp:Transcript_5218/g.7881  ORF Transcript_5218/g.7881 Transcript_5218/m.7881 type:complete len:87 (+) Transcript_5218:158-418(+)